MRNESVLCAGFGVSYVRHKTVTADYWEDGEDGEDGEDAVFGDLVSYTEQPSCMLYLHIQSMYIWRRLMQGCSQEQAERAPGAKTLMESEGSQN